MWQCFDAKIKLHIFLLYNNFYIYAILRNKSKLYCYIIVQLLSDEYGMMSPGSLEAQGLINASEYQKVAALTQSASPDAHKKIVGKHL